MIDKKALEMSAMTTVSAVAGALASVFFYKWIDSLKWWIAGILIVLYTLLIFGVLYYFFKK
jgi:putative Mn2+ efflux pump MntP